MRAWFSMPLSTWSYSNRRSASEIEANNPAGELPVHIESLLPSDGMSPDHGMDILHGFTTDHTPTLSTSRELGLLNPRVDCLERAKERKELWRELLERGDLGCEHGVSTGRRGGEKEESGETWGLELV